MDDDGDFHIRFNGLTLVIGVIPIVFGLAYLWHIWGNPGNEGELFGLFLVIVGIYGWWWSVK